MSKICPVCDRVYEDEHIFCAADGTTLRSQGGDDSLIGNVIDDRYVVRSLLGEGGMGRVYLGEHVHLPRRVAIKVLHAHLTTDMAAVARFNREATSTSRIENDRVARVFDFGRMEGGATYLAMEFVDGRTLSSVLDTDGALAPVRALDLLTQVAEGLTAAHRLNIVHRDLKPDNVLVAVDADGREQVKIVDFGIAKAIGPHEDSTLTAPGYVTGTPEYMSPEQLVGGTIDARSDVFALGLLAFRCLTNALPYAPPTPERGFGAMLSDTPKRLDAVAPMRQWPSGLQAAFDKVFARQPEGRYPSALAFTGALRDVIVEWEKTNRNIHETPTVDRGATPGADLAKQPAGDRDAPFALHAVHAVHDVHDVQAPLDERLAHGPSQWPDTEPFRKPVPPPPVRKSRTFAMTAAAAAVLLVAASLWRSSKESRDVPVAPSNASAPDSTGVTGVRPATPAAADTSTDAASGTRQTEGVRPAADALSRASGIEPARSSGRGASGGATTGATTVTTGATGATGGNASTARSASGNASASTGTARSAVRIDSVRDALDALLLGNDGDAPARALVLVTRIDGVLRSVGNSGDSVRVLLLKANALELSGARARACQAVDQARPLATSLADRNAIARNANLWSC